MNGIKLESQNNNLRYKLSVPEGTDMVFVCVVTKGADTMLELRTKIINGTTIVSNVEVSDLCGAPNTLVIDLRHSICETHHITINNVNLTLCKGDLTGIQYLCESCSKSEDCTFHHDVIKVSECPFYAKENAFKLMSEKTEKEYRLKHGDKTIIVKVVTDGVVIPKGIEDKSELIKIEKVYKLEPDTIPHYMLLKSKKDTIFVRFICRKVIPYVTTKADIVVENIDYRVLDTLVDIPENVQCTVKVNDILLAFDHGAFKSIGKLEEK